MPDEEYEDLYDYDYQEELSSAKPVNRLFFRFLPLIIQVGLTITVQSIIKIIIKNDIKIWLFQCLLSEKKCCLVSYD